jgi:predicted RNA-binding Zn ribbon-like protein
MTVTSSTWPHARDPAPGELRLVQDFVNTLDSNDGMGQIETLHGPADLERWMRERGLLGRGERIGPADLRRALDVRHALRALLLAHSGVRLDPAAVSRLNNAAEGAHVRIGLDDDGSTTLLRPAARGLDGLVAQLLAIVDRAMADGTWERLKACPNEDCEWAFYDRSRNRSSRWCNMGECGNRAKVRAYRERNRSG